MSTKIVFLLSAHVLLIKTVFAQCISPAMNNVDILPNVISENNHLPTNLLNGPIPGLPGGLTSVPGLPAITPGGFTSGNLMVKSSSPVTPTGLSVLAENLIIDGTLAVTGNLPFLGTVSVDGQVPAGGQSSVVYECGNGKVGMVSEGLPTPAPPAGLGPNMGNLGRVGGSNNGFGVANNLGRLGRIGGV